MFRLYCYLLLFVSFTAAGQETVDFDPFWEFSLDDGPWKTVRVPHDWSVSLPFDSLRGEGATGYLLGGKGRYRKTFTSPDRPVTYLYFDGVYNNATVSLNGRELGFHPYGYAPFYYDVSEYLRPAGETNELSVSVDRTRYADSRWYSGSGIYREVELLSTDALHVPVWGVSVTTPRVTAAAADVLVNVRVVNQGARTQDAELVTELRSPRGKTVATQRTQLSLKAGADRTLRQQMTVKNPLRWDINEPWLYTVVTRVVMDGEVRQEETAPCGIRTFRFDAREGFFLNGQNRKIKGVCLHHDGGAVGAAVPKAVWRRRLQTLKDAGCNAIRSAHNPASEEFLALCDEMGFLVQDEFYDEWDYPKDKRKNMAESTSTDYLTRGHHEHFQKWAKIDLQNTIYAHRNHPSIIQWSIGNEIEWTYPRQAASTGFFGADANGNYFWNQPPYAPEKIRQLQDSLPRQEHQIGATAQKLADWTREIDGTRPVVANCILPSASYESGYSDALDVIGFSYRRVMYDYAREHYPDLPTMGTENLVQYHEWQAIEERPWISGTFLWTGIDYLGESNGKWPKKHNSSGMLDLAGFPQASYYMMQSLWSEEPMIHLTTQTIAKSIFRITETGKVMERKPGSWQRALWSWHNVNPYWNYASGDTIIVEALSNCPTAELFLGGKSLGRQHLADQPDHIYKWAVPYAAGNLEVKGYQDDLVIREELRSAGKAAAIRLRQEGLEEEGIVQVVAELVDERGVPVRYQEGLLTFTVEGGTLLGVDNGAPTNTMAFQGGKVTTAYGKALAILRKDGNAATLTVTAAGLTAVRASY